MTTNFDFKTGVALLRRFSTLLPFYLLAGCAATTPAPRPLPVMLPDTCGAARPAVRFAPSYPRDAMINQINGWVVMQFDVDAAGRPGNVFVVDSSPQGVFEASAQEALLKFQFKPSPSGFHACHEMFNWTFHDTVHQ